MLRALVLSLRAARAKTGRPYAEIRAESAGTRLLLRYINGRVDWLSRQMPPGTERVFAGKVKAEGAAYSMLNPLSAPGAVGLPLLEPIWPLVKDLRLSQVAQGDGSGAGPPPRLPGMAGPAPAPPRELARLRRRAPDGAGARRRAAAARHPHPPRL